MKAKIDKILETPADEREIVENGKIFKKALDIILIAINILWFTSPFILIPFKLDSITTNVIAICINLCAFTVNLITFIFIMKTFKKNTYGGSINKTTNNLSTLFIINLINIIDGIIGVTGKANILVGHITLSGLMFIVSMIAMLVWMFGISAYLVRKYNKQKSI